MSRVPDKLQLVMSEYGGGVYKRIDETRELLELLQREVPQFLEQHAYVVGWLHRNDEFCTGLAEVVPPPHARFQPHKGPGDYTFPRAWPLKNGSMK